MNNTLNKYTEYINRHNENANNIFIQMANAEKRFGGNVPFKESCPTLLEYGLPENVHQIIEEAKAEKKSKFKEEDDKSFKRAIFLYVVICLLIDFIFSYITGWSLGWSIPFALLIGLIVTGFINASITEKREKPIREIVIPYEEEYKKYEDDLLAYEYWKNMKNIQFWDGLDGHSFERKVADVYKKLGYRTLVSKEGGDGGIDIELSGNGEKIAVQCKAHNKAVGPSVARDLYGTMISMGYRKGIIVSKNGFTKGVYEFVAGKSIELVDLDGIFKMVQQVEKERNDNSRLEGGKRLEERTSARPANTAINFVTNEYNNVNRTASTEKKNTAMTSENFKIKITFDSEFEQLYYEINNLIQKSKDPLFTAYLRDTLIEAQQNPESAKELRTKVIANYRTYVKRMVASGQSVDSFYFRSIYGDMDTPEIKKSI